MNLGGCGVVVKAAVMVEIPCTCTDILGFSCRVVT